MPREGRTCDVYGFRFALVERGVGAVLCVVAGVGVGLGVDVGAGVGVGVGVSVGLGVGVGVDVSVVWCCVIGVRCDKARDVRKYCVALRYVVLWRVLLCGWVGID